MWDVNEGDMKTFGTRDNSEETITMLGNRWWLQTVDQEGEKISRRLSCSAWKERDGCPNVEVYLVPSLHTFYILYRDRILLYR